jgi:hypothetical protein
VIHRYLIQIPTKDIPAEQDNLSPALAAVAAQIIMPDTWATTMRAVCSKVSARCRLSKRNELKGER